MTSKYRINKALILVTTLAACGWNTSGGERASTSPTVSNPSQGILKLIDRGELRPAICAAADYELELLSRYKPPSYEMGLFQDEATHLSFHSPFTSWKRADANKLELPKELPMTGITFLLGLEGASDEERLVVLCVHAKQLERRIGGAGAGLNFSSDRGLQLIAQMIVGQFGVVRSHTFHAIGDHRVLALEVAGQFTGPDMRVILLPHDGVFFLFLLSSPSGDFEANVERLEELIKTASFDYKTANKSAIAAVRAKFNRQDPVSLVRCAEDLARQGEYGAAAEDLADLRLVLYKRLPGAQINGNVASCPAYGLTLKNPDPAKWKLSTLNDGPMTGVALEDRFSVNNEGIMVAIIDLAVVFGPQVIKLLSSEETSKAVLIGSGRGGAMTIGKIESERLTTIKGSMAYEAIVAPNMPSVKARVYWVGRPDYAVMVLLIGNANEFEAKKAEFDRLVQDHLTLGDLPSGSGSLAGGKL